MFTPGLAPAAITERAAAKTLWAIRKHRGTEECREFLSHSWRYGNHKADRFLLPEQKVFIPGNILLTEGITEALLLITGGAATAFNNANSRLGVGDSNAASVANMLGLQAATNKTLKGMEATYPQVSGTQMVFRSVFGGSDANYDWNEFTIVNGPTELTDENLNRKVQASGSKAPGQIWTLDSAIQLS